MQTATFPMKILRFSAIWNTSTPHRKCSGTGYKSTNYRDYPTDLVGKDTGADWFYAPCDVTVLRVYGKASHCIWFRSTEKVLTPKGEGYLYFMCEHESVKGFKKGKTYRKGAKLFKEGKAGNATGNHIHLSCGFSKTKKEIGTGWKKNNHGAWVLYIPGVTNIKIEKAFFLDKKFTAVKDKRISFKTVPIIYEEGKTYTLQKARNVRISHKADAPRVSVSKWSKDAQKHADSSGRLKKGTKVTVRDVVITADGQIWLHIPSGWICAAAGGEVYVK